MQDGPAYCAESQFSLTRVARAQGGCASVSGLDYGGVHVGLVYAG